MQIQRSNAVVAEQERVGVDSAAAIVFELCAEDLPACRAAAAGGAQRIELCTALEVGGLTPSDTLIQAAVEQSGLPVHVLLRPQAETFEFNVADLRRILQSMERARRLGASGFVLGLLHEGKVDAVHTRELVKAAGDLPVTFHRAFDEVADKRGGLEMLVEAGCDRVLTSAGAPDVVAGAVGLAQLVEQAGTRIAVAAGGGLRVANAEEVARVSGARHFHGSLREVETAEGTAPLPLQERIARMVAALEHGAAAART